MTIKNPIKTTYFICRNEAMEIKSYGSVDSTQVMVTGQPHVKTYVMRYAWINNLEEEGIFIKDEL